jgi:hypothetical protein
MLLHTPFPCAGYYANPTLPCCCCCCCCRKAYRLGKFLQHVAAARQVTITTGTPREQVLAALALVNAVGEGTYYFLDQFLWWVGGWGGAGVEQGWQGPLRGRLLCRTKPDIRRREGSWLCVVHSTAGLKHRTLHSGPGSLSIACPWVDC